MTQSSPQTGFPGAIARGLRGLPGGETLFDLLAKHRGVRNVGRLPPLTEGQILAWADAYHAAHGEWPTCRCPEQGIPDTGGERWFNVDQALRKGLRVLAGGSSLPKLLAKHRSVPNLKKEARQPACRAENTLPLRHPSDSSTVAGVEFNRFSTCVTLARLTPR